MHAGIAGGFSLGGCHVLLCICGPHKSWQGPVKQSLCQPSCMDTSHTHAVPNDQYLSTNDRTNAHPNAATKIPIPFHQIPKINISESHSYIPITKGKEIVSIFIHNDIGSISPKNFNTIFYQTHYWRTRSIPWIPMAWLLVLPGHQ